MTKTKRSVRFWVALTVFSLIGQVAWVMENMYFNVFIYKMFNASAEAISMMVSAFTRKQPLSPKEIEELYAILEEAKSTATDS